METIYKDLEREFAVTINGTELVLSDPDPNRSPQVVMALYSNQYPELTTATVHGPEFKGDKVRYTFKTTIGTKG